MMSLLKTTFGHPRAPLRLRAVTLGQLNRALARVVRELDAHGFWDSSLAQVDVRLVPFGVPYGWQRYRSSGEIDVPAVSLSRLGDLLRGSYTSLANVLRHEYAHAIADTHRGLFRSTRFSECFEAAHDDGSAFEYDPELHVTRYASKAAAEDFAEVFMLWLRHGGVMPRRFDGLPAIERKWRFVAALSSAVRAGKKRW